MPDGKIVAAVAVGVVDPTRQPYRAFGKVGVARVAAAGARAAFIARQPMGRHGAAEEIAPHAGYLATHESAYTTGTESIIDGGMTV